MEEAMKGLIKMANSAADCAASLAYLCEIIKEATDDGNRT